MNENCLQCKRCKEFKSVDEFNLNTSIKNTRRMYCLKCRSETNLGGNWFTLYGINKSTVLKIVEEQNGLCKICSKLPKEGYKLQIDHDHLSGKFRGLICRSCNNALACVGDSVELLYKLIKYLEAGCPEIELLPSGRKGWTHCVYGHEFTEANTRWYRDGRRCRECDKNRSQRKRDKAKSNGI